MKFLTGLLRFLLPMIILAGGASVYVLDPLPVSALRLAAFDLYQRVQPRDYESAPVRIVDIDEASLQQLGQWPWPRPVLADLVTQLDRLGAAAIVFDVIFAEPDRTSPEFLAGFWDVPDEFRAVLEALPGHDALFAQSLEQRPVVLGFALERGVAVDGSAVPGRLPGEGLLVDAELVGPWRFVQRGGLVAPFLHPFNDFIGSLPELVAVAEGYGALSFVPDHDGVVRRVPLVLGLNDQPVPGLVAEALRVALGEQVFILRTGEEPDTGLAEVRVGPVAAATTRNGEVWVHYTRPQPERSLPAWQVLAADSESAVGDRIAGHIVFIGSSAQGLMDLRFSPLGGVIPGVEVHAQALEQILLERTLDRPHWANALELVALVGGGLIVAAVALAASALVAALLTSILALGWVAVGWWAFSQESLLLDPTMPALVMLLTFMAASLMRHWASEHRQRYLKTAFARYISPNLVEHLVAHPDALALGGERRTCSFIFTDLAGFTSMMEQMDPAQAVSLLNDYLDGMIRIAFEHQGTLDRIVGDAVAILFSAPVKQSDHARRALHCALAMQRFAESYTAEVVARGLGFGRTRIGVHSGEVIVGNFGGKTIFDYRALGDAVNTAARLESVNKHLGTWICVSEATLGLCTTLPSAGSESSLLGLPPFSATDGGPGVQARPVGRLVLKGKRLPLWVFEVRAQPANESDNDGWAAYARAYDTLVHGERESAHDQFVGLAQLHPVDPLVQLHLRRLKEGADGDLIVMAEK